MSRTRIFGTARDKSPPRIDSEWDLFRIYEACPPTASDDELRSFLETSRFQCALCPCRRVAFRHPVLAKE